MQTQKNATATICNTMPCLEVACRLKNDMDLTVDPCMDFFQYSCGGWVKRNSDVELKKSVMQTDMGKSLDTALKSIVTSQSRVERRPVNYQFK